MTKKELRKLKKSAKKAKKTAKKLGWKKILIILAVIIAILISFFGFCYFKYDDPFYFFKPRVQEEKPTPEEKPEVKPEVKPEEKPEEKPEINTDLSYLEEIELLKQNRKDVFETTFNAENISNKNEFDINGLKFSVPNQTYLETNNGLVIGNNTNPILSTSPWIIESKFDETTILSFSITLSNNETGKTNVNVSIGSENYTLTSDKTQSTKIGKDNLNVKASNFKLSIDNTKGTYLKSLRIVFKNPSFDVSKDIPEVTGTPVNPGYNGVKATSYEPITKEEYYKDINFALTENELRKELRDRINLGGKYVSYDDARISLVYTDEMIYKKGKVLSIYDGQEYDAVWGYGGKPWTREHVWPCSKMRRTTLKDPEKDYRPGGTTKDYRSDLHNLRVLTHNTNSSRNDKFYDEKKDVTDYSYFPNVSSNIDDDFRGDVARIIFYMALRYDDLSIVESPSKAGREMGKLSVLKRWAYEDPADEFEIQRNNRVYEYQGNRNPFIDYPELVAQLY